MFNVTENMQYYSIIYSLKNIVFKYRFSLKRKNTDWQQIAEENITREATVGWRILHIEELRNLSFFKLYYYCNKDR
jgi:hypothetical protein